MAHFFAEYGIFLAKLISIVLAILIGFAGILALLFKGKREATRGELEIKNLNEKFEKIKEAVNKEIQNKFELKAAKKKEKLEKKQEKERDKHEGRSRIFVLHFHGDIRASAVSSLREEITAVLLTARPQDEVLVCLESPGGMVNAYGLAASQLLRLREAGLKLTIAVDKVAASGGYMMACVADHIVAAPFSVIGSVGVVAQLPNFHRLLQKKHIDFEQITAGKYKRTLTMFGENTKEGRHKMKEDIEEAHQLFKSFIHKNRPVVDVEQIATGEVWYASKAIEMRLIDAIKTSDDYILEAYQHRDIFQVEYKTKKPLLKRLSTTVQNQLWALNKFQL